MYFEYAVVWEGDRSRCRSKAECGWLGGIDRAAVYQHTIGTENLQDGLAFLKDNLAVEGTDFRIVESDAAVRVASEGDLFIVDGIGGHHSRWLALLEQPDGAKLAHF